MKALFQKYLFAPLLMLLGLASMIGFQNCSTDVGFDQAPSAERLLDPDGGGLSNDGGNGGGDSDISIQINEEPGDRTVDDGDAIVDYEVVVPDNSGGSGSDKPDVEVQCFYNNEEYRNPATGELCGPKDRIVIPDPEVGNHTVTIVAVDDKGGREIREIPFVVYRRIVPMSRDISVTVESDQVDVIINVDNSGSMKSEQESMASRIQDFMDPFAGLDYHIAITTTSPIGNNEIWKPSLDYVDGKFVTLDNSGTHCIRSSVHNQNQAQTLIQNNVVRGLFLLNDDGSVFQGANGGTRPEGNGWERGIYTTYRAFERAVANTPGNGNCLRPNAAKHVILISDEDETTRYYDPTDEENPIKNMPDYDKSMGTNLVDYVASEFGQDTVFKFHSIIVDPDTAEGRECLQNGNGGRFGHFYSQLSQTTGGHIGSVCASNYASQLGQIGEQISNSSKTYNLECVAVVNGADMGVVVEKSSGNEVGVDYGFFGDKVEFADLLDAGEYTVNYFCYSMN